VLLVQEPGEEGGPNESSYSEQLPEASDNLQRLRWPHPSRFQRMASGITKATVVMSGCFLGNQSANSRIAPGLNAYWQCCTTKVPFAPDCVATRTVLFALLTCTVAPTITAPDVSTTVP